MTEKLNLNKNSVDFYWKTLDPRMLKILNMMEAVEPWVVEIGRASSRERV